MIGRAFLWGLAAAGEPGVPRAISVFAEELDIALALLGRPDFADIDCSVLGDG